MSTINEKLSELNTVKGNIMAAINYAYDESGVEKLVYSNTPFTQYADLIRNNLCRCQEPPVATYTVTITPNTAVYTLGNATVTKDGTSRTVTGSNGVYSGIETGSKVEIPVTGKQYGGNSYMITSASGATYVNGKVTINSLSGTMTVNLSFSGSYTISYNTNGGSGSVNSQTVQVNQNASSTQATLNNSYSGEKSGYELTRQWAKSSASGTQYAFGATYSQGYSLTNVTFYAVWQEVAPKESYYYFLGNANPSDLEQDFTEFNTTAITVPYNPNLPSFKFLYFVIPNDKYVEVTVSSGGIASTICDNNCDGGVHVSPCEACSVRGVDANTQKIIAYYSVNAVTQGSGDYTKIVVTDTLH